MKPKRYFIFSLFLVFGLLLAACSSGEQINSPSTKWEEYKSIYKTVVQYTGENESVGKYLEIAGRSAELFKLLEDK